MRHKPFQRLWIRLRVCRSVAPTICAIPYFASILWLLGKGQVWIAAVMLSPALVLALLIGLTFLLARLEFRGNWRG